MNDIDLIPQAYRTRRWQSQWLRFTAVSFGGVMIALVAGLSVLSTATANAKSRVAELQTRQSVTAQQRLDLQRLDGEKVELEQKFALLSGLRSGAAAEDMFLAIDRALTNDDLWFVEWQFERAGVMVSEGARTVNTGYFIVVPDDARPSSDGAIQVQTNMTIRGQSRDHAALSGFVGRLFAQKEIDDVRIRRTTANRNDKVGIVDFELAVTLNTDVRRH